MNTIEAVKSAPRENKLFANADAAYEQDEEITPNNDDFASVTGR
jgi:hypothetical protein